MRQILFALKNKLFLEKVCDVAIRSAIYGAVFLLPIFFLPGFAMPPEFGKQALLIFLAIISVFAWTLKTWIKKEVKLNIHKIYIAVAVLFSAYLLSTVFSVSRETSFWGSSQIASGSFISTICLLILYFLVSNDFSEKEIFVSFVLLSASVFIANLHGILQLFSIIPTSFTDGIPSIVGPFSSLGLLASATLPLLIVLFSLSKKILKLFFAAAIALSFAVLLFVNYNFVWIAVLSGCGLLAFFWAAKKNIFGVKPIFLPVFFVAISLFFIIFSPQINWLPSKPAEIFLSNRANLEIDFAALKDNPALGSGSGTFFYDFAKYKDKSFNESAIWNVGFVSGSSKILTDLAETGILGILSLILFFILLIFFGFKRLIFIASDENSEKSASLTLTALSILMAGLTGYFLLNSNIVLDFVYFFCVAVLTNLTARKEKTFALQPPSRLFAVFTTVFAIMLVFGGGFLILESRRFLAERNYGRAMREWQAGNAEKTQKHLKKAIDWNAKSDTYYNQTALFYLERFRAAANSGQNVRNPEIKALAGSAANAASAAIKINPENSANWSVQGHICLGLISVDDKAVECALKSFERAIALDPNNPYLYLQKGIVYFSASEGLSDENQEKKQVLSLATEMFKKSAELKSDYVLAYLHLGLVYYKQKEWSKAQAEFQKALAVYPNYGEALYYLGLSYYQQGFSQEAIAVFSKISSLFPDNQNIQKMLENLKNGKSPFENNNSQQLPIP